jgi:thymidylate kinase
MTGQGTKGSGTGPKVVVVGPDAAGKSTLVRHLCACGYNAHSCAQDHSYVADMWQRVARPDFLVFLDAQLRTIARRRAIDWGQQRLDEQQARLAHARAHCDLYLPTDDLTPSQVVGIVQTALSASGINPDATVVDVSHC